MTVGYAAVLVGDGKEALIVETLSLAALPTKFRHASGLVQRCLYVIVCSALSTCRQIKARVRF